MTGASNFELYFFTSLAPCLSRNSSFTDFTVGISDRTA
jgi:hypothetical protein